LSYVRLLSLVKGEGFNGMRVDSNGETKRSEKTTACCWRRKTWLVLLAFLASHLLLINQFINVKINQ
jgi:hypothetical protein